MTIERPTDLSPTGIKAWIVAVSKALGTTPTQFAKRANVAPSTVNKFLADPDTTRNLNGRTIAGLAETAQQLLGARQNTFTRMPEPDEEPIDPTLASAAVTEVQVVARSVDMRNEAYFPLFKITIPVPAPYFRFPLFAVQITDTHAYPEYLPGSLLVVETQPAFGRGHALSGERVMFAEVDETNDVVEMYVREVVESPSGDRWLIGLPAGKSRARDIYLGRHREASPNVTILGRVIMSLQPDRAIYGGAVGEDG